MRNTPSNQYFLFILQLITTMSSISFTFNPSAIPIVEQAVFMTRFFQLVTDYNIMTSPVAAPLVSAPSVSVPSVESLPPPSAFLPFEETESDAASEAAPLKKASKWAHLSKREKRAKRIANLAIGRENMARARQERKEGEERRMADEEQRRIARIDAEDAYLYDYDDEPLGTSNAEAAEYIRNAKARRSSNMVLYTE